MNEKIKALVSVLIVAVVASHLIEDNISIHDNKYSFPLFAISSSIVLGVIIIIIALLNYNYFTNKIFKKEKEGNKILYFIISTLFLVSFIYIPFYFLILWLRDSKFFINNFLTGLFITLLVTCLQLFILFSRSLYQLHYKNSKSKKISFTSSGKTHFIYYSEILLFFSEHKIVYLIQNNGKQIVTDFTLKELEEKLDKNFFFRVNRQVIIHRNAILSYQSIENGKLVVQIKDSLSFNKKTILVSRYKKKSFKIWLNENSTQ